MLGADYDLSFPFPPNKNIGGGGGASIGGGGGGAAPPDGIMELEWLLVRVLVF